MRESYGVPSGIEKTLVEDGRQDKRIGRLRTVEAVLFIELTDLDTQLNEKPGQLPRL